MFTSHLDILLVSVAFLLYLLVWFIKKQELIKTSRVNPNVILKATKPVQKFFGFFERFMTIAVVGLLLVHLFLPSNFIFVERLFSSSPFFLYLGFLFVVVGLLLCRIAQVTIGASWRVGIDEGAKPGLIVHGIYAFVRNPTYSGLYLLCIGVFLILPTILFSYWILAFYIMMEFQVRCEEEYLEKQYGAAYLKYAKKVKRYIPYLY